MSAPSPFIRHSDGTVEWQATDGDTYLVTGTDRAGHRFRLGPFTSWQHARCYNIWRGTFWLLRLDSNGVRRRYVIERR